MSLQILLNDASPSQDIKKKKKSMQFTIIACNITLTARPSHSIHIQIFMANQCIPCSGHLITIVNEIQVLTCNFGGK